MVAPPVGLGVVRTAGRDCGVLLSASSVTRDKANRPVTPQDTFGQRSLGRKWCLKQQLGSWDSSEGKGPFSGMEKRF